MDKKLKRFMSLVLAFIMILSSNTFVLADGNSNVGAGGGAGGTIVNHSGGDDVTTGYKIELLWIPLSDEVWSMKPSPEKTKKVNEAWNQAKITPTDTAGSGVEVQHLGTPVYITNDAVIKASKGTTAKVFKYGETKYGLGTRAGKTGITRDNKDTVTLKTYKTLKGEIAKSLNSVSPELSSVISNYNPSKDLPVYVGSKSESNVSSDDLKNFFMPVRPQENKNENTESGILYGIRTDVWIIDKWHLYFIIKHFCLGNRAVHLRTMSVFQIDQIPHMLSALLIKILCVCLGQFLHSRCDPGIRICIYFLHPGQQTVDHIYIPVGIHRGHSLIVNSVRESSLIAGGKLVILFHCVG